jgi:glycosyltransferase involved in cell wall biosynthesis
MGDGELHNELSAHITKNNTEKQIALLGFVQNGSIYYNAFDIFFLPSLKEGVPYVLLEAGIAGLPCIAGNVGGIPEVIENEKSGLLVTPSNTNDLKKAFENLCRNEPLRIELGTALKKNVTEWYSKKQMFEETEYLYQM